MASHDQRERQIATDERLLAEREAALVATQEKERILRETMARSAAEQERAAGILRDVIDQLERLSEEMRKHGRFPLADQLQRQRDDVRRSLASAEQ
jgi:hypothetical protein